MSKKDTSVQEQFASAWTEAVGTGETVIRVTSSIKDAVIESSKLSDYAYFEPKEAIVLVTGSLYLVGGVLEILEENIY